MVKYVEYPDYNLVLTQTTGGAVADIPNSGWTVISSTAAERYVLAAPVPGAYKCIVAFGSAGTTGSRTIELSPVSSGDTITLTHTTGGTATATEILLETTAMSRVELLGLASTQWLLLGSNLCVAASTGIVFQTS